MEMSSWHLAIVPIQSGAGTRIKIVDAFSRKCPVVSTRFGAYGYEIRDYEHVRFADTAEEFVDACQALLSNPTLGPAMAERAWELFVERWTWDAIAPTIRKTLDAGLTG